LFIILPNLNKYDIELKCCVILWCWINSASYIRLDGTVSGGEGDRKNWSPI